MDERAKVALVGGRGLLAEYALTAGLDRYGMGGAGRYKRLFEELSRRARSRMG